MNTVLVSTQQWIKDFISFIISFIFGDKEEPDEDVIVRDMSESILNSDEVTQQVINNINREFQGEVFARLRRILINEAKYTPLGNCRTLDEALKANSVGNIPKELDSPGEAIIKPFCSRVSYTVWVLYDTHHNPHVFQPAPTRGLISIGPDTLPMEADAEPMPVDVTHAIKIVIGTRLFDCQLNGFSVQHFINFDWFGKEGNHE